MEPYRNCRPRTNLPSLCCLPALIGEIDGRRYRPKPLEREVMIARYRRIERGLCMKNCRELAPKMVNNYLIDVLWRTRKYRKEAPDATSD